MKGRASSVRWPAALVFLSLPATAACSAQPDASAKSGSPSPMEGSGGAAPGGAANYTQPGAGGALSSGGTPATTPPPGGASDGGAPVPIAPTQDPQYDARVGFDWPEAVRDGGTVCQAGHYAGTFQCNYVPPLADGGVPTGTPTSPFVVTGPIELVLTESQNGEFLEVSGGTLNGAALIAITFTGKISGKLDCQTGQFNGLVSDGQYGIQPFPPGGAFSGPTNATYSSTGPALVNGSWQFTVKTPQGAPQGTCNGTWTATYAP